MMTVKRSELEVTKLLDRLIALSIEHRYNPYKEFDWPATLPQNEYWMSPHLLSVYGTPYIEQMSERMKQFVIGKRQKEQTEKEIAK